MEWERAGEPWTELEKANLRRVMEAFPPPAVTPWGDLERLFRRPRSGIKKQISVLGLARGTGIRGPDVCEECGGSFKRDMVKQRTCSIGCGRKLSLRERGHPRGATGYRFTPEQLAKVAAASQTRWDAMSPEQRAAQVAPMRLGREAALREVPSEQLYSRGRGGRRPDLNNRYFRSRWEANYARYLDWLMSHGQIYGWEYEPRTFEFPVKKGNRFYTPDFKVWPSGVDYEWHEVKGWMDANSRTKLARFARYFPEEHLVLIDQDVYRSLAVQMCSLIEGWE